MQLNLLLEDAGNLLSHADSLHVHVQVDQRLPVEVLDLVVDAVVFLNHIGLGLKLNFGAVVPHQELVVAVVDVVDFEGLVLCFQKEGMYHVIKSLLPDLELVDDAGLEKYHGVDFVSVEVRESQASLVIQ